MRDDEWIKVLSESTSSIIIESLKRIFTFYNELPKITDNESAVNHHINCVMCYVAHLPQKQQLSRVISSILPNYPQLRNIPIVGDDMTQSSFQTGNISLHYYLKYI